MDAPMVFFCIRKLRQNDVNVGKTGIGRAMRMRHLYSRRVGHCQPQWRLNQRRLETERARRQVQQVRRPSIDDTAPLVSCMHRRIRRHQIGLLVSNTRTIERRPSLLLHITTVQPEVARHRLVLHPDAVRRQLITCTANSSESWTTQTTGTTRSPAHTCILSTYNSKYV